MPELNYEMKNLENMWTRIAATNKIEIVCAVLEDEIIELKKHSSITTNNHMSDLIEILEKRIEELSAHFHSHKKPFNGTPKA
jgi:ribosomal protein S15P/S13E|tara:strand:- start:107 stop:352 length:246 start_codon:yes stop_codon:yes gene_type:complete